MDDQQELKYLRKWYNDNRDEYSFKYILALASIITALTSILAILKAYDLEVSFILPVVGIFLAIATFLLIMTFLGNFLGWKR